MTVCLYLGPTLTPRDALRLLDARCLPPVRHGDVYRAVSLLRPRAIGIIDGYFQWVPSVWHKEILWALQQGVHVFGAASMGALRAAELAPFGMRGIGRIFEAYRDGVLAGCGDEPFEDDDEVAVVHGPAETGYIAASEAMINIRCTLADAQRAGIIDAPARETLVAMAKAQFFADRTYESLLERADAAGIPEAQLASLRAWLPGRRVNQKRADAIAMIDSMREFLAGDVVPARPTFSFEHTTLWEYAVAALQPSTLHDADEMQALDELRVDAVRFCELRHQVVDALLALPSKARPDDESPEACSTTAPLSAHSELDGLARDQALDFAREEIPTLLVERQILTRIRETGEYAALLARAQHKRARVAECSADLPQVDHFSGPQLLELQSWYFEHFDREIPDDLAGYLRDCGYADERQFHEAIFAEYVYRQMVESTSSEHAGTLASA